MKKWTVLLLVMLIMTFLTKIPKVTAEEINDENSLKVGTLTAFTGNFFNRGLGGTTSDWDVIDLIHGYSLVYWDNEAGKYVINPMVVANYSSSYDENGLQYLEFTVKDYLTYSDGSPINARDYVFNILLCASPMAKANNVRISENCFINGWEAYNNGKSKVFAGVHLLSDYKFAITTGEAFVDYFYSLALMNWQPYPIHVIAPGCEVCDDGNGAYISGELTEERLKETLYNEVNGYISHPTVTSGPYVLTSYDGTTCEFDLNPEYYGNALGQKPSISHITYSVVSNENLAELLTKEKIDLVTKITNKLTFARIDSLRTANVYNSVSYPRSGCSLFSFSCERIATGETAVRQAIAYCINKDGLVESYVGDNGVRVDGYYGIGQWMVQLISGKIGPLAQSIDENANEGEKAALTMLQEKWSKVNMGEIPVYEQDIEKAKQLLSENGWNLGSDGEAYVSGVRWKAFDAQELQNEGKYEAALEQGGKLVNGKMLMPLKLKCGYPEGNLIADALNENLIDPLYQAGISLTATPMPMDELLDQYYHNGERTLDMVYVAVNFSTYFSPTSNFDPAASVTGDNNYTELIDEELYSYAKGMGLTTPGDDYTYCQYWIKFQQRFQELVPAIAVYSNYYYDYYTKRLDNYQPSEYLSWPEAICSAKLLTHEELALREQQAEQNSAQEE